MLLQTKRTLMRPFIESDIESLNKLCSSVQAMHFIPPHFGVETEEQVRQRLENYIQHHDEHGIGFCLVTDKKANVIGRAGFCFIPEVNLYEIGYSLLPEYWGQGLATEIVTALLNYAFDDLWLDAVCARTIVGNDASDYVLQKTGFTYMGERAFAINNRIFIWNYYEHQNEAGIESYHQLHETLVEDWDI